jgi:hypothetical protein
MNTERDPFGLSSLNAPEPPGDAWPSVEAALKAERSRWSIRPGLAAAAALTLALSIYFYLPPPGQPGITNPMQDPVVQTEAASDAAAQSTPSPGQDDLVSMIRLSQQLEKNVRQARSELGMMPAQALVYQVELEDLVAQMDYALNQDPDSLDLWSQRVSLLLDLNELYRQQLRRDYSHVASL